VPHSKAVGQCETGGFASYPQQCRGIRDSIIGAVGLKDCDGLTRAAPSHGFSALQIGTHANALRLSAVHQKKHRGPGCLATAPPLIGSMPRIAQN